MINVVKADAIEFLKAQPPDSLDLVFGSPPYEQARLYLEDGVDMGISRKTVQWVDWMVEVYQAAQVACKGLVAFVVAGQTRKFSWSAGPALLMAELHYSGMNLRNPPIFHRVGIPGSGGPDWLRSDYEWIVCTSRKGKLPWSNNTACGHEPKYPPGGAMSHRNAEGSRKNERGYSGMGNAERKREHRLAVANGKGLTGGKGQRLSTREHQPSYRLGTATRGSSNGDTDTFSGVYDPPAKANPGNLLKFEVGGGVMGDRLCHENEAPFPEKLAEFFVLSFCPPCGVVCDPFLGSGTTASMALKNGRNFTGCDLRQSQVDLSNRRLAQYTEVPA